MLFFSLYFAEIAKMILQLNEHFNGIISRLKERATYNKEKTHFSLSTSNFLCLDLGSPNFDFSPFSLLPFLPFFSFSFHHPTPFPLSPLLHFSLNFPFVELGLGFRQQKKKKQHLICLSFICWVFMPFYMYNATERNLRG